jgi:hypothetical protein
MEHAPPDLIVVGVTTVLGFVVLPMWIFMRLADYFCHRASDIEHTSGTLESTMHLAQFGLVGVPLLAGLLLRVDTGVLILAAVFAILHHIVAFVDVRYANKTRVVYPIEQMIHSFLEILPLTALILLGCLNFDQLEALTGVGIAAADFGLHLRKPALPIWYVATVLSAAFGIGLGPFLEEFIRCLAAQPRTSLQQ